MKFVALFLFSLFVVSAVNAKKCNEGEDFEDGELWLYNDCSKQLTCKNGMFADYGDYNCPEGTVCQQKSRVKDECVQSGLD